ncbi:MAG: CHAT domain-containing protein [Acidobacteria bacterium]|nr:CHAT domain-containing protein [Acidobacteriota bacterium]
MKIDFSKWLLLSVLAMISLASISANAQPGDSQKRTAAKAAFDEAIELRTKRTFQSYQAALLKFEESARLYGEIGDRANYGSSMLGVGLIKDLLGESDAALKIYLDVLEIFREVGQVSLQARTLNNLGNLYSERGNYLKAIEYHSDALVFRRLTTDISGEAQTLNSLGFAYAGLGERQLALDSFKKALRIRHERGELRDEAIVLSNIGLLYNALGDNERAIGYLEGSLALRRRTGDRGGEAITLNNLGMAVSDTEPQAAIVHFENALKIFSELGFENQKATLFNNFGNAYLGLKDRRKALEYFQLALEAHTKNQDRPGLATVLNNIGLANFELGAPHLDSFNQSLLLARETQDRDLEAIVLSNLMRAYHRSSQLPVAIFFGKQCVNRYQELRSAIKGLDAASQKSYLTSIEDQYRFLADILISVGQFADAENILRMLKEEEFSGFVRRDGDEVKTLAQRANLTEKEKTLIERYSKLADQVSQAGEKFQKLDDKKRLLSRQDGALSADEEKEYLRLSAELTDANAAFKLFLEKELIKEIGSEKAKTVQADRDLQSRLRSFGNGTVALSTVVTDERYRVVVTTPTVQIAGKTDIKASELNKKIFAFRKSLQDPKSDPRPLAKELYDILIKPVETVLTDSKAKTLVWSLDGTLRYIPLAALSSDGKTYLVEKYQNVIVTRQTRDDIGDSNVEWKGLGMGVSTEQSVFYPDYPDEPIRLEALPAVEDELKTLIRESGDPTEKGILAGRRFLNDDFTLKNLTDSLARRSRDGKTEYTVVHFASHFRLAENWSTSFLLMGNGRILTLEEFGNSPLLDFSNVELITLSACNTASEDDSNGAEVESFASLIQTRNGKAVLATLWEVEDKSTAKLMSSFYGYLKANPKATKADAMQYAQKLLLTGPKTEAPANAKTRNFSHPAYWSPFVLIGNWR